MYERVNRVWLVMLLLLSSLGDQPIFGEMPRWSGLWSTGCSDPLERDVLSKIPIPNPPIITRIEGVYTWEKTIGSSLNYVWLYGKENLNGERLEPGIADVRFAVPLKSISI